MDFVYEVVRKERIIMAKFNIEVELDWMNEEAYSIDDELKVLHISQDTEAPGQFYVVYECEDGAIWSRPYGMFVSEVDHVKYPNVKQKYRFELVGEDDAD